MVAIRFRSADAPRRMMRRARAALLLCIAAALATSTPSAVEPLRDRPMAWFEDDRRPIPMPAPQDPNLTWSLITASVHRPLARLTDPVRNVRRLGALFGGDHVRPAANVNALDEALASCWFTPRIGLFPMTPVQVARGPGDGRGPSREGRWTVVRAKTEGVTPGFQIADARGQVYVIKFDPPGHLGMTSAAAVIANRLLHAAGYNVPDDTVVEFRREQLRVGPEVRLTLDHEATRAMDDADLDRILAGVERTEEGLWRAVASKFLSGRPLGPFDYGGRRSNDPNDRVDHEDRRELRGLRVFAAWINHFDTKRHNSLDMYVGEDGEGFVRHYLIDFASTLGAGARGPYPVFGYEYDLDFPASLRRLLTLGLIEDPWRRLERIPGLPEIGYFDSDTFSPAAWKPQIRNSAFANLTDRDGYWAAKIVSAFTDELIRAAVATGRYRDPAAADSVVHILGRRRDEIARHWFERCAPLDFFVPADSGIAFSDLGVERGLWSAGDTRYRVRVAAVTSEREGDGWSAWMTTPETRIELASGPLATHLDAPPRSAEQRPFLACECQVDRGGGWSPSVTVYQARASGRIVALER